jgi:pimeloyl-ACP methyl ester carboxylesterase
MKFHFRDAELYFEDYGAGVPLLLLSAFPFDHRMWREQKALGDVARLLMPDYRGIGSSSLTLGPYTMDLLADDMAALLDRAAVTQAVVVGDSMGVYVAFSLLERHPERVRAVVFSDSRAEADTPEQAERRQTTADGLRNEGTAVLRSRVDDLFAATTRRTRPALVFEMQTQVATMRAEGLAWLTQGMALRHDRRALLPRISVPALLLCGEEDTVSPPAGMQAMAGAIPNADFHLIPQAGHLAPLEQPEVWNRYVREFISRV